MLTSTLGSSPGYKSSNSRQAEVLNGDGDSESFGIRVSTMGNKTVVFGLGRAGNKDFGIGRG